MKKTEIKARLKEELEVLKTKVDKDCKKIADQLESLRKKLEPEMTARTTLGDTNTAPFKSVSLVTVAEILDLPINELIIYLITHVKNSPKRNGVEYHLGHVYFYPEDAHE
jgi:hypothetical protein